MFATLLAALAAIGGLLYVRRKRRSPVEEEPWRASLEQDDEPLDLEEIRRAEEEWLAEGGVDEEDGDDEEPWR